MTEKAKDYLDIEELAEILNRPAQDIQRMEVKADERTIQALKAGSARILRPEPTVRSPKQLRADFHTVAHHTEKSPLEVMTKELKGEAVSKRVLSQYLKTHATSRKKTLSVRPPGAPSILDEVVTPVKIIIHQHQSPGDILMLTAAVRDLHKSHPGKFITDVRTNSKELWENNPYVTTLSDRDADVHALHAEYPLINQSNSHPFHFIHGFIQDMESKLGVKIKPGDFKGDIHLSGQEKQWYSQVWESVQKQTPFWIIDAGHKMDFTAKHWDTASYQAVVDEFPDIYFVQVGAVGTNHNHPRLTGDNVIDLVGKTSIRQMVRLMYNSAGVITPVSFPMHLAAAVEVHKWYKRKHRPCIVLAGGREPAVWEGYSNHQYMHTCGMLPCNKEGGCWKSRTVPVGDGDKKDTAGLCERPVKAESGNIVPLCMDMITPTAVISKMQNYLRHYDYSSDDPNDWGPKAYEGFPEEVQKLRDAALAKVVNKDIKGK